MPKVVMKKGPHEGPRYSCGWGAFIVGQEAEVSDEAAKYLLSEDCPAQFDEVGGGSKKRKAPEYENRALSADDSTISKRGGK